MGPASAATSPILRRNYRRAVHAGMLGWALLLRFLAPWQAIAIACGALIFNWKLLPRLGINLGKADASEAGEANARAGIVIYPLTVTVLLLLFADRIYIAGAAWAILALGDSAAAAVGQHARRRWSYNRFKSPLGSLAYFCAAALGAFAFLLYLRAPTTHLHSAIIAASAALASALVESLPVRLDDNFTAPLAGALVIALALAVRPEYLAAAATLIQHRWLWALCVSGGMALITWRAGLIATSGAIAGFVIAAAIYLGLNWPGFVALLTFFVLGTAATKTGYARKLQLGIAERRGGRRRWTQVLANGLVPASAAVLALVSGHPERDALALVAALAEAASDTVSSEVGQALSRTVYLIGTFETVPVGTDGGISLFGTAAGIFASFVLAVVAATTHLVPSHAIWTVVLAATAGNLLDSVLGATLERRLLLDNDSVNFVGTLAAALLAVALSS